MREECAVFGIHGSDEAALMTYLGLYSLQHRGQESAGIATYDGRRMHEYKAMGLVAKVFGPEILERLTGHIAIGHNRYSTTGLSHAANIQPLLVDCRIGRIALAHNGNIVNAVELRDALESDGSIFRSTMDSELILHLIARSRERDVEGMIAEALGALRGAYALVFLLPGRIIAARDPRGFRPLCLGRLGAAWIVASESCAFDILGASYEREIEPGEILSLGPGEPRSVRFAAAADPLSRCIFEFIYFSRPDSRVFGANVDRVRRRLGRRLAEEDRADADIVISVPDSSNTIALGYSEASGIRFELGLIRNHYVGRTFIEPRQADRDWDVRIKFNPVRGVLAGRRVAVVDDSIVRGSTMRKLVTLIRGAGAAEVHLRIGSPQITHSCYYGIDTPTRGELISSSHTVEQIREYLAVDSLHFLSLEGLLSCVDDPRNYCVSCFSGDYPVERGAEYSKDVFDRRGDCGGGCGGDTEADGSGF